MAKVFERPADMPNLNNEGFAVGTASEFSGGFKPAFWSDDTQTSTFALRQGTVTCGTP